MSETLQSEVVKSVSEVEFEKSRKYPEGYETKKHANSTISNNGKMSPRDGTGGSKNGSQFLPSLLNATLPSRIAIIVGLCQVAVGGVMVLIGVLAIRYQSYMFHYGTGLWAGLLCSITGLLQVMCTKRGVPKPSWLCGGRKWQIHTFLLAIVFSLFSAILLSIFSISGLLQDAKTYMAVDKGYQTGLEELMEARNTNGIFINTILLLLSILQILLCFSSLGITVRVMFKTKGALLSSKGSTGSEIAIRDGGEYHARKDHLIHWLGHQHPNGIPRGLVGTGSPPKMQKYSPQPQFVAIQPMMYPSPRMIPYPVPYMSIQRPSPQVIMAPSQFSFGGPPPQHLVPICHMHRVTPTPSLVMPPRSRRTGTPVSSIASLSGQAEHQRQRQRKRQQAINRINNGGIIMGTSMKSFQTQSVLSSKAPSVISVKTESEKNNEVEVTEVDVSRTYTGLDRSIADDYICAMNLRKSSSISVVSHPEDVEEEDDSEAEITRM